MKAVEKLLLLTQPETGVQPTPCEGAARLKEALTWAACEKAISRFKKGKAVGSDLLDGYLLFAAHSDGRHPKGLLAPASRDCGDERVPARMERLDCDASDEAGGGPEGA